MTIRYERMAALGAVEVSYGVDPTPTAAVQMKDVSIDPVVGDLVDVGVLRPGMGGNIKAFFGRRVNLKGKILLGAAGAAGTAPAWDFLARCTGHAVTTTPATKVEYTPIDSGFESAAIYFNCEGNRTIMLGTRGSIIWRWVVGQFPEGEFNLVGIWASDTNVAYPAVDYTAWKTPPLVGKDQVPLFQIGGVDEVMQSLEINSGGTADYVERINRREVEIGDRIATMTAVIEEPAFSARNYFTAVGVPGTYKSLALTHGTAAGAKVLATATNWQLGQPQRQKLGNNLGLQIPGTIVSLSGTPDYKITVQ
ncbi:MAG TPA: hypothetical protein VFB13_00730 [Reyranella sp.]|jgi:hypothetical protein|nr:hypothetical protein [Reyranella sp.]